MQRELKNTGVPPLSIAEVYNRCTQKICLKSNQTMPPLENNLKRVKHIETTL